MRARGFHQDEAGSIRMAGLGPTWCWTRLTTRAAIWARFPTLTGAAGKAMAREYSGRASGACDCRIARGEGPLGLGTRRTGGACGAESIRIESMNASAPTPTSLSQRDQGLAHSRATHQSLSSRLRDSTIHRASVVPSSGTRQLIARQGGGMQPPRRTPSM